MAKYESKVNYTPHATAEQVYAKLSNLESFKPLLENLADNPLVRQKIEEEGQDPKILEQLKDVKLTADTITFPVPMLGSMTLEIIEREENRCIKMQAANEVGVPLKDNGYNGDLTAKQVGSVGGQMVKRMIENYENSAK